MQLEDAKKILSGNIITVSPEILQKAAKIILSELGKAEEKISALKKKFYNSQRIIAKLEKNLPPVENLLGEEWRDVVGYEGLYQVSNKGRVKSLRYRQENILVPKKGWQNGYLSVSFSQHCKAKKFLIHRLVAQAFLPNPKNFPVVHHKDDNKKIIA